MKKVAIVGYTPTREQAPFENKDWEIWGMNDLYKLIPRYTRWFEFHGKHRTDFVHKTKPGRSPWAEVEKTLSQMTCPVYLQEQVPGIPCSVKYPLDEILAEFGQYFVDPDHAKYFTNTVSYMLALAIYEKFDEIHVYGVDMATASEYGAQKPSCEFWLGVALGRGIKIHIPAESDLLKTRFMYGYERKKQDLFEAKIQEMIKNLENKKAQAVQRKRGFEAEEYQYLGALTAVKEMMQAWE